MVIIRHLYENGHDVLTHNMNACGAKRGIDLLMLSFSMAQRPRVGQGHLIIEAS